MTRIVRVRGRSSGFPSVSPAVAALVVALVWAVAGHPPANIATAGQAEGDPTLRGLREARARGAEAALLLGLHRCEEGDVSSGMLWLARSLELAPADDEAMQSTICTSLSGWRSGSRR